MEGVGARFGRSSTRYGPATVFTGPVRRWKRKWVPVTPPSSTTTTHHSSHQINGQSNGNNGSHLLLYKWTPITQSQNGAISNNNHHEVANGDKDKDDPLAGNDEPPRRKFKYIPIVVLEEQQNEAAQQVEDEAIDNELVETEANAKNDVLDEKPNINDTPMEEDNNQVVCQDLNETLDLSFGFNEQEGEAGSAQKTE